MQAMWLTEAVKEVGTCFSSLSEKQLHIELHCTLTVDHSLQVDLQLCVGKSLLWRLVSACAAVKMNYVVCTFRFLLLNPLHYWQQNMSFSGTLLLHKVTKYQYNGWMGKIYVSITTCSSSKVQHYTVVVIRALFIELCCLEILVFHTLNLIC